MRVTNSMMVSNYLNNLNGSMSRMDQLQTQMANNSKYAHISDDPVSVIYSLQARYRLDCLEQYQKSVDIAESWNMQAETSVMEMNDIMKSAYELCISAATNVKTDSDRNNMAQEIGQLRDALLQSLNTTFGDKYVFAGFNTTGAFPGDTLQVPFTVDGNGNLLLNGVNLNDISDPANLTKIQELQNEKMSFVVGAGLEIDGTVNGVDLVGTGEGNLYTLLNDLYNALTSGATVEEINEFIPKLQQGQEHLLSTAAELGGRANRLELLASRYSLDNLNYTQMKSNAEDADEAEVIMNFKMAETVYKAALSVGSYVIQPTLMDFLR